MSRVWGSRESRRDCDRKSVWGRKKPVVSRERGGVIRENAD